MKRNVSLPVVVLVVALALAVVGFFVYRGSSREAAKAETAESYLRGQMAAPTQPVPAPTPPRPNKTGGQ